MSRKRIFSTLAALAALAALTALLSACGGGGSSEEPQKVIEQATFEGVGSGELALSMNVATTGQEPGHVKVDLSGPFQSTGKKSLPELALTATANGEANGKKVDFEGGLTVLNDRAFVGYGGKQYEVEPTVFGLIKSGFESAEQEGAAESKGGEATACQQAATSMDLSEFVTNLENEGGEEVGGVKTTKLSGDLDPKRAVDAVIKLAETPACSSEFEMAGGQQALQALKSQKGQLTSAVKVAHAEIYVGEDDHIVRKVVAETTIEPQGSGEKSEVELEFTLSNVNGKQTIKAPANAEPLTNLFSALGVNPNEILGLLQGGGGEGIGGLLEGLMGGLGGEGSTGGASGGEGEGLGAGEVLPKGFEECLKEAKSATEIQKCASLME